MDYLTIICLGIGFVSLLVSLLLILIKSPKGNKKIAPGILPLLLVGLISLLTGVVLMVPDLKEKITSTVPNQEEVHTLAEKSKGEATVSTETEPLKIARELVEKEMSKQVGLKSWEITKNNVTSDQYINNISDYDKPVGDKRIVWIEGYVKATAADDGSTGSVGYNLELYQMKGDNKWYIGKHWGVLDDIEVIEKPVVNEAGLELSDSEELPGGKGSSLSAIESSSPEQSALTENYLKGAWHWNDLDDFYMILRDDYTYSYIEQNAGFVSEGTYAADKIDDRFEVTVNYTTGENDSVMTIKLIDQNHLEGIEGGINWKAKRMNLEEAEGILNSLKGE
ncbi:hypothetical protein [Virgibacillus sp. DJP39]|uniref:hypothetical protein n=1 Tax=Virgibacillus sp. DJP39 TaxID=3409790 RepID=UPI003BB64DCE